VNDKTLSKNSIGDNSHVGNKKTNLSEKKDSAEVRNIKKKKPTRDDMFSEFQRVCNEIASHSSYLEKTAFVKRLFTKGCDKGR
jgi:hypothetical protein